MLIETLLAVVLAGSGWEGPEPGLVAASSIVVAADDHTLYAIGAASTSDTGILRSSDRGQSWEKLADNPPAEIFTGLWADPLDADRVFAATEHAGFAFFTLKLYRSVDRGQTWTVRTEEIGGAGTLSVAFDASRPDTLYVAASNNPLFLRSENAGGSFVQLDVPFTPFRGSQVHVAPNGDVLLVTDDAVFRSRDQGEHWTRLPSPAGTCPPFTALAIDPTNPDRMFLGTGSPSAACGRVFRTLDGGTTWSETAAVDGPVSDLSIDSFHPSLVYAATFPTDPTPPGGRVFASGDDGANWQDLALPVTTGASQLALVDGGHRLYAATPAGVYARNFRRTRKLEPRP